ncbi:hypothetical protein COU57_05460 [Candidatus Pacearchaeota archaeon CG10_big_fil_rev_8_21_14_0_10_32_14]|nr:MAG: hypothetical protein COU57_05460 [Candidatus Pacearchaeota archaeon CG10_big_fil_rev_8_21_14_0_10_32_14]
MTDENNELKLYEAKVKDIYSVNDPHDDYDMFFKTYVIGRNEDEAKENLIIPELSELDWKLLRTQEVRNLTSREISLEEVLVPGYRIIVQKD